jgi:hypothetical protein
MSGGPPEPDLARIRELPGYTRTEPQYFKDPMVDRLLEVVMMLGGEFWVMRDRMMVLERLLATEGRVTPDLIETFKPDDTFSKALAQQREQFIRRVFGVLYPEGKRGDKDHFAWITEGAKSDSPP